MKVWKVVRKRHRHGKEILASCFSQSLLCLEYKIGEFVRPPHVAILNGFGICAFGIELAARSFAKLHTSPWGDSDLVLFEAIGKGKMELPFKYMPDNVSSEGMFQALDFENITYYSTFRDMWPAYTVMFRELMIIKETEI